MFELGIAGTVAGAAAVLFLAGLAVGGMLGESHGARAAWQEGYRLGKADGFNEGRKSEREDGEWEGGLR